MYKGARKDKCSAHPQSNANEKFNDKLARVLMYQGNKIYKLVST